MAELVFLYGKMGCSKSAQALMSNYDFTCKGFNCVMLKPRVETRDGENTIRSRIGLSAPCQVAEDFIDKAISEDKFVDNVDIIIVDEAQFLEEKYIDALSDLVDFKNISVYCYGLRTDFRTKLFPGSKRLMEIADSLVEIGTSFACGSNELGDQNHAHKCNHKAIHNMRVMNGHIVTDGDTVLLGNEHENADKIKYIPVCRKCYKEELMKAKK